VLNGLISAVGCVIGGWGADRFGLWWAYFGSGVAIGLVAIAMAIAARTPATYAIGVLSYSLTQGLAYAAFSAMVLVAIGRGAASLNTLPSRHLGIFQSFT
jgi:MFS transporter, PAT family, beta-lactamase induction signal transducer AmpG